MKKKTDKEKGQDIIDKYKREKALEKMKKCLKEWNEFEAKYSQKRSWEK